MGNVNLKVLTTVSSAMEEFRNKIDAELTISILWGSQDIERSIQDICTLSYLSDAKANPILSNQTYYECAVCKTITSSPDHRCDRPEQTYGTHDLKEPLSVRQIFPAVFIRTEVPVIPRTAQLVRSGNHKSLESEMLSCTVCGNNFPSSLELEKHQKDHHSASHRYTDEQKLE